MVVKQMFILQDKAVSLFLVLVEMNSNSVLRHGKIQGNTVLVLVSGSRHTDKQTVTNINQLT